MELQHFGHKHPLLLKKGVHINHICGICGLFIRSDSSYGCDSCKYYIHERCAGLAKQIAHPFHPSHPLSLITDRRRRDDRQSHRSVMDKVCVLRPMTTTTKRGRDPTTRPREFPEEIKRETCEACGWGCSGQPTYGCRRCWYFLHGSCAELPLEVEHPFHPRHSLSLCVADGVHYYTCKLCGKENKTGFAFKCSSDHQCGLWLCVPCGTTETSRRLVIEHSKAHEHPLYFVEEVRAKFDWCSGYETYCKQRVLSDSDELRRTCSSVFRCLECDFTLHLLCGPLPRTIKHDCHVDPLTLVDSVIEDGFDEYYCDVCETERNPRICVYYCEECKFIAHVHCVASEIVKILKGDTSGNMELKSVGEDEFDDDTEPNDQVEECEESVMTLKDVINKLDEDERKTLGWYYKWDIESSDHNNTTTTRSDQTEKDTETTLKLSRFTRQDFEEFINELFLCFRYSELELKPSDLALKIVKVKSDYLIPQTLAPVLRKLLREYGDVSVDDSSSYSKSKSREWKCVIYFLLCQVVKQMRGTKVGDITRDLLREWFHHMEFVKLYCHFRIGFACASLDGLMCAFLGAQSKRLEREIPTRINREIGELQQKIADLQREIEKKKAGLEKCNEYRGASPKSDFMKECVKKASELRWKDASHELFLHPSKADHGVWYW